LHQPAATVQPVRYAVSGGLQHGDDGVGLDGPEVPRAVGTQAPGEVPERELGGVPGSTGHAEG